MCGTFWRTWTLARQVLWVYDLAQSGHWWVATTNSTSNVCWTIVPALASAWMVIFILIRFECGSVQMKLASMILDLFRPLNFRKHSASSSRDSGAAVIHCAGGECHLSQSLQQCIVHSRWIPAEISTLSLIQSPHRASKTSVEVPSIGAPQLQQRIVAVRCAWGADSGIVDSTSMAMVTKS